MSFVTLVVCSLATWRMSHMIVKENGPLMVFTRLRAHLATKQERSGGLFDLVSCIYCISVWIGLIAALFTSHSLIQWLGNGLAFSAVAVALEMLLNAKGAITIRQDEKSFADIVSLKAEHQQESS